jgi:3-oxoacyl-[acyl-carrier-protein] synthase III
MDQVGIHGIGVHLPAEIRRNDWWPASTVARWREKNARNSARGHENLASLPLGVQRTIAAMLAERDDPFRGSVERRVMPEGAAVSDMETAAAREAIARAGVPADQIRFVLTYSLAPDFLISTNACRIHKNLGLPERCLSLATEAACNTFQMQLTLAESLIRSGEGPYGLIVQSFLGSRLVPAEEPHSAWFGDGATAAVIGPVDRGRGILARAHRTDGSRHRSLVAGVPGKRWYDDGRVIIYLEDAGVAHEMVLAVTGRGEQVVAEALAEAGLDRGGVDFFACHQATSWLRELTQRHVGLDRARSVDTFRSFGSLSAANLPLVLAIGEREGQLRDGDVVTLFSGGVGETWSATVLRWGTG